MENNELSGLVSWIFERARRTSNKLVKLICDERKFEMMGLEGEIVRLVHTTALFETLRQINIPEYLISRDMDVDDKVLSSYCDFLSQTHKDFLNLARTIQEWTPENNNTKTKASNKKSLIKHPHPKNN